MSVAHSARLHPTAVVSPEAEIADNVEVGPFVVIEGHVRIGAGCVLRPHVHICGSVTLGENNLICTGAVIGEKPQHLKYDNEPTGVEIGAHNIIREHVTIHRGTTHSWQTRIGDHCFLMAGCHVAHDCQLGDHVMMANGALLAGHCVVAERAYLSGNCAIHQFVHVGRLALLGGGSISTKDIPPFVIQQGINCVCAVNVIGMRRAGIDAASIETVRRAFHILYSGDLLMSKAVEQVEAELGHVDVVREMTTFIRESKRGVNVMRERDRTAA